MERQHDARVRVEPVPRVGFHDLAHADHAITEITDGMSYGSPGWSPNDLYLAFSAYPQTEPPTAAGGMFVMRPDGSGRLLILPDGVGPVWQPAP